MNSENEAFLNVHVLNRHETYISNGCDLMLKMNRRIIWLPVTDNYEHLIR